MTSPFKIEEHHPLIKLLLFYYRSYDDLREEYQSLNNHSFQSNYGLRVDVPDNWPISQAVKETCDLLPGGKVLVIYSGTDSFKRLYELLGDRADYMSWTEIYTAMHRGAEDVRLVQRVKDKISGSDLTFFIDASDAIKDVIEQVKAYSDNCLIVVG